MAEAGESQDQGLIGSKRNPRERQRNRNRSRVRFPASRREAAEAGGRTSAARRHRHPRDRSRAGPGGTQPVGRCTGLVRYRRRAVDRFLLCCPGDLASPPARHALAPARIELRLQPRLSDRHSWSAAALHGDDADGAHPGADPTRPADLRANDAGLGHRVVLQPGGDPGLGFRPFPPWRAARGYGDGNGHDFRPDFRDRSSGTPCSWRGRQAGSSG